MMQQHQQQQGMFPPLPPHMMMYQAQPPQQQHQMGMEDYTVEEYMRYYDWYNSVTGGAHSGDSAQPPGFDMAPPANAFGFESSSAPPGMEGPPGMDAPPGMELPPGF